MIAQDFAFHGNSAANTLRNFHDHGTGPGDARTTRTKRARQDPASGAGVLSNPVGARETAPRGAGVPSYAGAPLVSVQPLSGWA